MQAIAEQFANDWLLVIENDQDSWNQLTDTVKELDYDVLRISQALRGEWDELVSQISELVEDQISDVASLLLRQMLYTGDYPFEVIARHVVERVKEVVNV